MEKVAHTLATEGAFALKRQREQKSEECARLKRLRKASESTHAKNRAAIVRLHNIEADIGELQARF